MYIEQIPLVDKIDPIQELLHSVGVGELVIDTASFAMIGASRVLRYSPRFGGVRGADLNLFTKPFDKTLVTRGDRASQSLITHCIDQKYPDSTIWGEEGIIKNGSSKIEWLFDPLDGTGMYPAGVGASVTAVMCSVENKPVASAIVDPFQKTMIIAQEGKVWVMDIIQQRLEESRMKSSGTLVDKRMYFWHDTTLRATTCGRLGLLLTGLLRSFPGHDFTELSTGSNVNNQMALCRAGGDLQITYAIGGPWDILPGAFAIEQAGGKVTDLNGGAVSKETKGGMLSASNSGIHAKALVVVKEAFKSYKNFREG